MSLAVLSNEGLNPQVNWTTLGPPLLHRLADRPEAELFCPPPASRQNLRELARLARRARHHRSVFWMQGSARPELPVWMLSAARLRQRRSAFVVDAWRPQLDRIGRLATAQRLDPCFVAFREGYEELSERFPRARFEWLPFGVDTEVFQDLGVERDIFAYSMGRGHEPLSTALESYCRSRGLKYVRTTAGEVRNTSDLRALVSRSRYFLVTPPDLTDRNRTGGFSPLVMRYLEGLAAGCRLVGVLPSSGEYEQLLPLDAIVEVAADGSNLAERLDLDSEDPGASRATELARDLVRNEHSWNRRAEQISSRLLG